MVRGMWNRVAVIATSASLSIFVVGCGGSRCSPGEVPNDVLQACVIPKKCAQGAALNERNECVMMQPTEADPDAGFHLPDAAVDVDSGGRPGEAGAQASSGTMSGSAPSDMPAPGMEANAGSSSQAQGSAGAAGSPAEERPPVEPPAPPVCGNGIREAEELCDGADCVSSCPTSNSCLVSTFSGSSATCDAHCSEPVEITECKSGDGCCAKGCNNASDDDCSASCGDGVVSAMETCEKDDPNKPCPTSCDDGNPCTKDLMTGSAEQCNVACANMLITSPAPDDDCCPDGANIGSDNDCEAMCGDGVVTDGETCEPNSREHRCPTDCDDGDVCTIDEAIGSARSCTAACRNTPIQRSGPNAAADCDDGNPCTRDSVVESSASCSSECQNTPIQRSGPKSAADCDDGNPCTSDSVVNSTSSCSATCQNTPIQRSGPKTAADCDDGNPCTKDSVVNSTSTCATQCQYDAIGPGNACGGCSALANPLHGDCTVRRDTCSAPGTWQCDGKDAVKCVSPGSGSEICDGQDNDCDDHIDENACFF